MDLDLRKNSQFSPKIHAILKSISLRKAKDFNLLISSFSKPFSANLDWWVEQPSSRNIHQSPLFYRYCCLHLVSELINSGIRLEKIIVDSSAFYRIVDQLRVKQDFDFEIDGPVEELPHFHYYYWKSIKLFLRFWKLMRPQFRAAKKTKHLAENPPKISLTLIDQYVTPGFISKDRYYNGLWDSLNSEQKKKTFFVPTLVLFKPQDFETAYNELRTSDRNFLIKEDYLTLLDLLFSLLHIFRIWFIKPSFQEVLGTDFSVLIREGLLSSGGYNNAIIGLLNYRFAKRLKEKSFDFSLIIDWWEGQPLDKGWNLGFHTFFPNTPIKGYLGYVPRFTELQVCPTINEIECGVSPKIISTVGKKFCNEILSTKPPFEAETAPAFRFNHLWKSDFHNEENSNGLKVLVALSTINYESENILEKVSNLVKNSIPS